MVNATQTNEHRDPTHPQLDDFVKTLIVGAGNINFGSDEGPWNHSLRLERKLGRRLKVVGLVDPNVARAKAVLESKSLSLSSAAYAGTIVFPSIAEARQGLVGNEPDLTILGTPPAFRGTIDPSRDCDAEVQICQGFPNTALFVEKPVSAGQVGEAQAVAKYLQARNSTTTSVGYMLRYSAATQKIKQILEENDLTVMMTSARYIMAYTAARKPAWWNKSVDGGPIVEQATHFVDLSRYFAGDINLDSVSAQSVEWYDPPGKLSQMQIDESVIPETERIPRFTSATWKYENGAIGHLEHGVALQGKDFATELAVYADGYLLKLVDPYNRPTLYVRSPGKDSEEVYNFPDDDPFSNELETFIDVALEGKSKVPILSSYEDAVKTYEATWAIRRASEATRAVRT